MVVVTERDRLRDSQEASDARERDLNDRVATLTDALQVERGRVASMTAHRDTLSSELTAQAQAAHALQEQVAVVLEAAKADRAEHTKLIDEAAQLSAQLQRTGGDLDRERRRCQDLSDALATAEEAHKQSTQQLQDAVKVTRRFRVLLGGGGGGASGEDQR